MRVPGCADFREWPRLDVQRDFTGRGETAQLRIGLCLHCDGRVVIAESHDVDAAPPHGRARHCHGRRCSRPDVDQPAIGCQNLKRRLGRRAADIIHDHVDGAAARGIAVRGNEISRRRKHDGFVGAEALGALQRFAVAAHGDDPTGAEPLCCSHRDQTGDPGGAKNQHRLARPHPPTPRQPEPCGKSGIAERRRSVVGDTIGDRKRQSADRSACVRPSSRTERPAR